MDHSAPASTSRLSWKHSILASDSNITLTSVCVWCLLLNHSRKDRRTAVQPPSTHTKKNAFFFSYAAEHWANHFNQLSARNQKKITSVALEVCDARGSYFLSWFPVYWRSRHARVVTGFTTLMAASYFGLEPVVRRILKTDYSQLKRSDRTYCRSALSWAAGNGHDGVVKRLICGLSIGLRTLKVVLRQGANINALDSDNRTPLTYAIWNRHLPVIQRLVEVGAWVDIPDVLGGTPTSYAFTSGYFEIENLVLRRDFLSNSEHNEGEKLLLSASKYGHIHVVRVLLEARKTNLNPRDGCGWTPLMWAINYRHSRIIKLLLEHKADVNTRDKTGMTPLHFATRYGQFEIAKLILQTGCADVNLPDLAGLTPLHLAARWKRDDIAQLILRTGIANVIARVRGQGSVYSWVFRYNSCSTLKLMLDLYDDPSSFRDCTTAILETDWDWVDKLEVMMNSRKVDMNVSDTHGETVLHEAVIKRSYKLIRELLASGNSSINCRNSRGLTPLAQACLIMDLDAVSAFLETNLWGLNIADSLGNTPLHHAIQAGSVPITSALISTGNVDVAMKNMDGHTPLSLACLGGNISFVKYLLDSSQADINTQDTHGRTPAHNCIWVEDVDMFRLILKTGRTKLNVVDSFQCTPLLLAVYQSKWHMASLLLNHKQAVNMKGQK
ncbi:Ankyrin repeat domain containing protein 50 [Fusarium agapanthi]|uniref:Ankyrin repeat domain containing protein 50 n=1 Tax=Fusarium agapanthi TaxID=1803897 RepID=A0A9P5B2V5_9HYPO|nr:Ankyrin repeat domain containing protein 50 [Fusarium agapanthi]